MSSMLKSILMLQKGILPPQAGMPHGLNPNVLQFLQGDSGIVIPTEPTEFKGVADKPKRILINNFDAAASFPPRIRWEDHANDGLSSLGRKCMYNSRRIQARSG